VRCTDLRELQYQQRQVKRHQFLLVCAGTSSQRRRGKKRLGGTMLTILPEHCTWILSAMGRQPAHGVPRNCWNTRVIEKERTKKRTNENGNCSFDVPDCLIHEQTHVVVFCLTHRPTDVTAATSVAQRRIRNKFEYCTNARTFLVEKQKCFIREEIVTREIFRNE
jgi:hypothetical protein